MRISRAKARLATSLLLWRPWRGSTLERATRCILTDVQDGYRLTPMEAGLAKQMAAAEDSMREDRDVLHQRPRPGAGHTL